MAVYVGSARIDENGNAHGGKAGKQKPIEVSKQAYYVHKKGWRVFRAKSAEVAAKLAACMGWACESNYIGYDQYERNTLYNEVKNYGFDVRKLKKNVETDCSALVRVCCAYAGITSIPTEFRTVNMPSYLNKTGEFIELTGSKYTESSAYLAAGDILVTKTSGHTVIVLNNGKYAESHVETKEYSFGDRELKHGCTGADVKTLQEYLIKLGYSCGAYGADSDFGDCTEKAVIEYQRDNGKLEVDGVAGAKTIAAIITDIEAETKTDGRLVKIVNGSCWVRSEPNTGGAKIGNATEGKVYLYEGVTDNGWNKIEYKGVSGWVSGRYSEILM